MAIDDIAPRLWPAHEETCAIPIVYTHFTGGGLGLADGLCHRLPSVERPRRRLDLRLTSFRNLP
jgi:hypothetical protein